MRDVRMRGFASRALVETALDTIYEIMQPMERVFRRVREEAIQQ